MIWLRWSWRDLRSRWIQVATIAFVIAVGTGIFSGLRSMSDWREMSNDASYEATNTFDLRVKLGTGSFVERGSLLEALQEADDGSVAAAEERLVLPTQVSVQTDQGVVIVPGRLIGVDLSEGGPHINSLHPARGRLLQEADEGRDVVALELNFAKYYNLPAEGSLTLTGDLPVRYVGQVLTPEYFTVVTEEGGFLAQANFAAVFTSIETAQRLSGMEGRVNDLLLTTRPGRRRRPVHGHGVTVRRARGHGRAKDGRPIHQAHGRGRQRRPPVQHRARNRHIRRRRLRGVQPDQQDRGGAAPRDRHRARAGTSGTPGRPQTSALQRPDRLARRPVRHRHGNRRGAGA